MGLRALVNTEQDPRHQSQVNSAEIGQHSLEPVKKIFMWMIYLIAEFLRNCFPLEELNELPGLMSKKKRHKIFSWASRTALCHPSPTAHRPPTLLDNDSSQTLHEELTLSQVLCSMLAIDVRQSWCPGARGSEHLTTQRRHGSSWPAGSAGLLPGGLPLPPPTPCGTELTMPGGDRRGRGKPRGSLLPKQRAWLVPGNGEEGVTTTGELPCGKWMWKWLNCVRLFATLWIMQSMEFSRPEYWTG